jgi:N-acetylneuraminate synthase
MTFDFRDLFIFEMANNHQGSVEHGKRIIQEMARIAKEKGIRAAVKLQFRDLDTFVHSVPPSKHIKRFLETRLSWDEFAVLVEEIRKNDLITMCTPFDEASVDKIVEMGIEVIKVGSPSNKDWPLIEKVAKAGKPVIFSTGGLTMREIDDVSRFLDWANVHHAIMHCVSIYPTPAEHFQLHQIGALCRRYPDKVIGFSSHEGRWQHSPIGIAYAQGARIFERHVGIDTTMSVDPNPISLNAYSAGPGYVEQWIRDYQSARTLCGATERPESPPEEQAALQELRRIQPPTPRDPVQEIISQAVYTVRTMLAEAKIAPPPDFKLELSHHHGLVRFPYVGATIINVVNREYCKKLIVLTPGQGHPRHYHNKKEETFQILSGALNVTLDGGMQTLWPGDTVVIKPGVWHSFTATHIMGAIIEEISTTHHNDDSFYSDPLITALKREERKTIVEGWGGH